MVIARPFVVRVSARLAPVLLDQGGDDVGDLLLLPPPELAYGGEGVDGAPFLVGLLDAGGLDGDAGGVAGRPAGRSASDTVSCSRKQRGRNRSTAWSPAAKGTVAA